MKKIVLNSAIASMMFIAMTACSSDNDIFNPNQKEADTKKAYAENFAEKFPGVSLNQSWDYSTGGFLLKRGTRAGDNVSIQTIPGLDFGIDVERDENGNIANQNITKNKAIYDAIWNLLPDAVQHEGDPVVLVAPSSSFYIFPLTVQGYCHHNLKIRVGNNEPVTIYEKTVQDFTHPYVNGMINGWNTSETVSMPAVKVEAPVGTPVEIFLDDLWWDKPEDVREMVPAGTSNAQAIYVDVPKVQLELPEGVQLAEDAVIKFIGIEDIPIKDADGNDHGDRDYNDVVLAVVGDPDVPEEVIIQNDQYTVPMSVAKRYFLEDLGSLDDFDFNDIVVDVFQDYTILHKVTLENGLKVSDVAEDPVAAGQRAIVRALGGTIDFELQIGNTTWKKSSKFNYKDMINTRDIDYNKVLDEFVVTGWNPDANNVSVKVEETSGNVYTVEFPGYGSAPMIIAKDINKTWQAERVSVDAAWFSNN